MTSYSRPGDQDDTDLTPSLSSAALRQRALPDPLHTSTSFSTTDSDVCLDDPAQTAKKANQSPASLRITSTSPETQGLPLQGGEKRPGQHAKDSSADTMGSDSRFYRSYFADGAHRKNIRKAPWVSLPVRGTEEIWIETEQEAVEWLSLFYGMSCAWSSCGIPPR
jgi:hypothetical protein